MSYEPKEELALTDSARLLDETSDASVKPKYQTFNPDDSSSSANSSVVDFGRRSLLDPSDKNNIPSKMGTHDIETGNNTTSSSPPKTFGQKVKEVMLNNLLVLLLIASLILGIVLGIALRQRPEPYSKRELMYLRFPGELLMNMLKLLILPLIVSSLISGMTSLDTRASGKLGLRAVVYYLTTTLAAVVMGIVLVVSIQPGKRGDKPKGTKEFREVEPADTFLDLIRQMFPDNIVEATFQKTLTKLKNDTVETPKDEANSTTMATMVSTTVASVLNSTDDSNITTTPVPPIIPEKIPVMEDVKGINMLGLVVFSIAIGIAINRMGDKGRPLKELFESLSEVTLVLVSVVIWYSPVGVLFLVMEEVVSMDDPEEKFKQLSFYFITVMSGLAVHGFFTLPLLFFIICRSNPYKFMYGILQALVTALGTSSSSATLPVTMRNLEENNGVDPRVTGFVAPVGATINMDGTALYEAVAVIFIGQVEGFDLDIGTIIIVCLTSTAAAIGAAGVPQAGLVTMVIVLTAVGFPADRVGLILAIDWLLDRFRTAVNVLGDAYGAGIVNHLSRADLERMDEEDRQASMELEVKSPENGQVADVKDVRLSPSNGTVATESKGHNNAAFSERL